MNSRNTKAGRCGSDIRGMPKRHVASRTLAQCGLGEIVTKISGRPILVGIIMAVRYNSGWKRVLMMTDWGKTPSEGPNMPESKRATGEAAAASGADDGGVPITSSSSISGPLSCEARRTLRAHSKQNMRVHLNLQGSIMSSCWWYGAFWGCKLVVWGDALRTE